MAARAEKTVLTQGPSSERKGRRAPVHSLDALAHRFKYRSTPAFSARRASGLKVHAEEVRGDIRARIAALSSSLKSYSDEALQVLRKRRCRLARASAGRGTSVVQALGAIVVYSRIIADAGADFDRAYTSIRWLRNGAEALSRASSPPRSFSLRFSFGP